MGPTVLSIPQCPGMRGSPSASSLPGSHGGLPASNFHGNGPSLLLLQTCGPDMGRLVHWDRLASFFQGTMKPVTMQAVPLLYVPSSSITAPLLGIWSQSKARGTHWAGLQCPVL